jgi:hypothetical protein
LREHKNIIIQKLDVIFIESLNNKLRQAVAVADEGDMVERVEYERHWKTLVSG